MFVKWASGVRKHPTYFYFCSFQAKFIKKFNFAEVRFNHFFGGVAPKFTVSVAKKKPKMKEAKAGSSSGVIDLTDDGVVKKKRGRKRKDEKMIAEMQKGEKLLKACITYANMVMVHFYLIISHCKLILLIQRLELIKRGKEYAINELKLEHMFISFGIFKYQYAVHF